MLANKRERDKLGKRGSSKRKRAEAKTIARRLATSVASWARLSGLSRALLGFVGLGYPALGLKCQFSLRFRLSYPARYPARYPALVGLRNL